MQPIDELVAKVRREGARVASADARAIDALVDAVLRSTYQPSPAQLFHLKRPPKKPRPVAALVWQDRVVQRALLDVLRRRAPLHLPRVVTGYVPGRSALALVHWLERRLGDEPWVWSLDVVDFFPSVNHERLRRALSVVEDPRLHALVVDALTQPLRVGRRVIRPTQGLVQGSPLSPWLSNLYLRPVDLRWAAGHRYGRYCDNIYLVGAQGHIRRYAAMLAAELAGLGLRVRLRPAEPAAAEVGIECLGYHVQRGGRRPSAAARSSFLLRMRARVERRDADAARALLRGHRGYFYPNVRGTQMETWDEVDVLLRQGRFAEAMRRMDGMRQPEVDDSLELDDADTAALLRAVGGDPGRFAEIGGAGRTVVARGLRPADLDAHRRGERELGVLPSDGRGFAHVGVVDLDGEPDADTRGDALKIAGALGDRGRGALIEETGGRGHHVWVPLERPRPSAEVTRLMRQVTAAAGVPPPGVRRELFPSPPDADPAVRLPLGNHPRTGRRSRLFDPEGRAIRHGDDLRRAVEAPRRKDAAPGVRSAAVRTVLSACPLRMRRRACARQRCARCSRPVRCSRPWPSAPRRRGT